MKLIFLDFDGVINSNKYFASKIFIKEYNTCGGDYHPIKLDKKKIKLINKLVHESGASVVVSSAWRLQYCVCELNDLLKQRGAEFAVIDTTPIFDNGSILRTVPRGEEIQLYIDTICIEPESFVIIDDYADMLHLSKYLVQTDSEVGITEEDVKNALQILEKNYGERKESKG